MIGSANLANEAKDMIVPVLVSFETGEQLTAMNRIYPPPSVDWELVAGRYEVVKALAGTDAGTVDIKDDAGSVAVTQLSLAASTALGTRGTFTVNTTARRVRAGAGQANQFHTITTAKATAGGRVQLWLTYRRVRPNAPLP